MQNKNQYNYLKKLYPNTMNKEQLRIEAHISKRTATRLILDKHIPCKTTGKKTRQYTLKTDDVIAFLNDRDKHPWKYSKKYSNRIVLRNKLFIELCKLSEPQLSAMRANLSMLSDGYSDLMTSEQAAKYSGYPKSSLFTWCGQGKIHKITLGKAYHIPKSELLKFLTEVTKHNFLRPSAAHLKLIEDGLNMMKGGDENQVSNNANCTTD